MKTINVPFEKEEHDALLEMKGKMSWRELIYRSRWFIGVLNREPKSEFGENWQIDPPIKIEKPCHLCGYCPYGQLIEAFEVYQKSDAPPREQSCQVFGHDCPAFYCAEPIGEDIDDEDADAEEED